MIDNAIVELTQRERATNNHNEYCGSYDEYGRSFRQKSRHIGDDYGKKQREGYRHPQHGTTHVALLLFVHIIVGDVAYMYPFVWIVAEKEQ